MSDRFSPARRHIHTKETMTKPERPDNMTVFVYGTMRSGGSLADYYIDADTIRTPATVPGDLWPVPGSRPPFPGYDPTGTGTVTGEVIDMPLFDYWQLAAMEEAAGYDISTVVATTDSGQQVVARVFVAPRPVTIQPIQHGDWLRYIADLTTGVTD